MDGYETLLMAVELTNDGMDPNEAADIALAAADEMNGLEYDAEMGLQPVAA